MNCRDVKAEMALHAGQDDVDRSRWEEVRRHVSTCPSCRGHYRRLKGAMTLLDQADPVSTYETRGSLWPELASRLEAPPQRNGMQGPRGWLPHASVAAVCLLLVAVWSYPPPASPPTASPTGRQTLPLPSSWSADRQHVRQEEKEEREVEQREKESPAPDS